MASGTSFNELKSAAYPFDPAVPPGPPDDMVQPYEPPNPDVIDPPMTSEEVEAYRGNFIELMIRKVVEGLTGFFSPGLGSAIQQLRNWADNVPGLAQILDLLDGVRNFTQDVIDGIVGFAMGGIADVVAWANDVAQDAAQALSGVVKLITRAGGQVIEDVSDALEAAGQGVRNIINSIVAGLTGLFGNWTLGDAGDALEGHAAAMAAHAAAIAAMQATAQKDNLGAVGITVDLTVEADALELPSMFTTTYSGPDTSSWGISDGATGWWNASGNRAARARYNGVVTDSDYQVVGAVFSSAPGTHSVFGQGETNARNIIRGRINDLDTHSVEAEFTRKAVLLRCIVAGVEYVFDSEPHTFRPNTAYYLRCGTTGGLRTFQVIQGTTPILTYTDVGNVSSAGVGYRGAGVGSKTQQTVLGGVLHPGRVTYFMMGDSVPAPTIGSFFRVYRADSANGSVSNGDHPMPASWYDTIDRATGDFEYDFATNTLTCLNEGTYAVSIGQRFSSAVSTILIQTLVYQNGVIAKRSTRVSNTSTLHGMMIVYCLPGDELVPGYGSSDAMPGKIDGEPTGASTYFEVALINRSLA